MLPDEPAVEPASPRGRLHEGFFPALVRSIAARPLLGRLYPVAERYAITLRRSPEDVVDIGTAGVSILHCFADDHSGKPYVLLERGAVIAEGELREVVD